MAEHPIEGLMSTAMNSIKDMIDVNTIIGDPIQGPNNIAIIPISKVSFGFAAGGSEFKGETVDEYNKKDKDEQIQYRLPFGGGAGAGVSVNPVAFLVVQGNVVKLLPVNHSTSIDKLLDYIPDLFDKANNMMNKCIQDKKEQTQEILSQMQKMAKEKEKNQSEQNKQKEAQASNTNQESNNQKGNNNEQNGNNNKQKNNSADNKAEEVIEMESGFLGQDENDIIKDDDV